MNKTMSYVNLFRNVKEGKVTWGMTFRVGETDVSCNSVPAVDYGAFVPKVSKSGTTKYLGSKYPLVVEFDDIRAGVKPGKFFANVSAVVEPPKADATKLDALLDGAPSGAEAAKDEPKVEPETEDDAL